MRKPKSARSKRASSIQKALLPTTGTTASSRLITQLRALVKRIHDQPLVARWRIGQLARQALGSAPTGREQAALAERIGLIEPPRPRDRHRDYSTLRQVLKFAALATERQAARMESAGIAWRGVMYWMGLEDPAQRETLYGKMLAGLRNSTEIREYINARFRKRPLPRVAPDLAKACQQVHARTREWSAFLEAFQEAHSRGRAEAPWPRSRRRSPHLRELDRCLQEASLMLQGLRRAIRQRAADL